MKLNYAGIILILTLPLTWLISGCKKEKEILQVKTSLEKLFPLEIGKVDFYRMDSLTIDTKEEELIPNPYLIMEIVTAISTDNLNHPVWRIERYMSKDTTGKSEEWLPAGNYFVAVYPEKIEVIENNLRFIKLTLPLKLSHYWRGNSYLPPDAYQNIFEFSIDNNMPNWNYTYTGINDSIHLPRDLTFGKVATVAHIDQSFNVIESTNTIESRENFATREKSMEQYAEEVGLIYREQILWEYQPNRGNLNGYMLKMWRVNL
ncbi:MAG: hypothetical protein KGP35_07570 [Bacteroidetes bacterium]|nr:hypothetical protein [Bacteroidota bacterium]